MKWPWNRSRDRRSVTDEARYERAVHADETADEQLEYARRVAEEAQRLGNESAYIRNQNHFGAAVAASFKPRGKKRPWPMH